MTNHYVPLETVDDEAHLKLTNSNYVTFTKYTSTGPLSKSYSFDASGAVVKQAAAQMHTGIAERVTMPFADFAEALNQATVSQAFGYGTFAPTYPDKVSITIKGKENLEENIISRSKDHFTYSGPGVLMIDYDPSEYGKPFTPDELLVALTSIHPEIAQSAYIIRGSISSGINLKGEASNA
jgi:hypothetical protein